MAKHEDNAPFFSASQQSLSGVHNEAIKKEELKLLRVYALGLRCRVITVHPSIAQCTVDGLHNGWMSS